MEIIDKEKIYQEQFDNLKEHIGEDVICLYQIDKTTTTETGKLEAVNAFRNVEVNRSGIPFVGIRIAIKGIISCQTLEVLYVNDKVNEESIEDQKTLRRLTFGNKFADRVEKEDQKEQEEYQKQQRDAAFIALQQRPVFLERSASLVNPELKEGWEQLVIANTENGYNAAVIEASICVLEMIEAQKEGKEIKEFVYTDINNLGLTGFQASAACEIAAYYAKKGQYFQEYLGVTTPEIEGKTPYQKENSNN